MWGGVSSRKIESVTTFMVESLASALDIWRHHALNVCSGNLWFLDWVFAGKILSSLKLRQEAYLVRSADLENPKRPACEKKLRLYSYAMHKSIVTIETLVLRWALLRRLI